MRRLLLATVLVVAAAVPARAQIHIDIRLPGPPAFAVIPGVPVYYAPQAHDNVFFYAGQYWVFAGGGWHVGPGWSGPWVVVAPGRVPLPILHVPVRYYHVPPPAWRGWRRDAPPRWEGHYGREWHEDTHERGWREKEEHWSRERAKGHDRREGHGPPSHGGGRGRR